MIHKSHPRYESLMTRERLVEGCKNGLVATQGLIAHGRGEAFDYLLGETTIPPAREAIDVCAAYLLGAERPVISVNGNAAVLVGEALIGLARVVNAKLEVNLFHRTEERVRRLVRLLSDFQDADKVRIMGQTADARLPGLGSHRASCCSEGIYSADVVMVMLEDGDRTQALIDMDKIVLSVDLNPLSRTARSATVNITDNVTRAVEHLTERCGALLGTDAGGLRALIYSFNSDENLAEVLRYIGQRLGCENL